MARTLVGALLNKTPVPYVSARHNLALAEHAPRGQEAQMRAMGSVGTLFAIVTVIANAVAQVDWKLYRKATSGMAEDRQEVTSHAALDLWNKPNGFMPRQEFVETFAQHMELTGEAWWVVARDPRSPLPLELWPARPDRMEPVPHVTEFLASYQYRGPAGELIPLERRDVVFLRSPNPLDPYRGMGPVQSILTDLDSTRYSAEWNRSFFRNSAEPGGIIETEKSLNDDEFDQFQARWGEQHKGVANAHRVALIESGMKWVDRKLSQRDMQFVELRGVSRDVIREAFGIPAFALGDMGDVNRATALAAQAWFAEQITVPRLERIKGALNSELLPLYVGGDRLEFDYCNPVPPDADAVNAELTTKTTAAKNLIDAGAYGPAVLEALGLPEIAFGQPNADPDRELLIKLVTNAPTLAPLLLPALGIPLPEQDDPSASPVATAKALAEVLQKAYLSVGTVLTRDEVRQLAADAGVILDPNAAFPDPVPAAPSPAVRSLSVFDLKRRALPMRNATEDPLEQVREDHAAALDALLTDWEPIDDAWIDALGDQIETAVDDGDTEALASMAVDSERAAGVLRGALAATAQQAAARMADEAANQGVTITVPQVDITARMKPGQIVAWGDELEGIAATVAALVAAGMVAAAAAEAVRRWMPGAVGSTVATAVEGFLRGLKGRSRDDQLGGALHRAQTTGRFAALEAAPAARYVATEVNDHSQCAPCAEIDGTEWDDLADAMAAYGAGPYHLCEGGIRCRGTVTAIWDTTGDG